MVPASIKRFDNFLAITTESYEIHLLSLDDLPEINIVATVQLPKQFGDFYFDFQKQILYTSNYFDGIWQYNFDASYNLTFVDSSMKGILVSQIETDNDTLYLLDEYNGILRYAIDSVGSLSFVDYLFVPLRATGFLKFDSLFAITINSDMLLLGKFDRIGNGLVDSLIISLTAKDIYQADSFLVLVNERTIETVSKNSFSTIANLPVSNLRTSGELLNIEGKDFLALPSLNSGISVFRLDSLSESEAILSRNGPVNDFFVYDNNLILGTGDGPVDLYQFSVDFEPVYDTSIFISLGGVNSLVGFNDRLYVNYYQPDDIIVFNQISNSGAYPDSSITADATGILSLKMQDGYFDDSLKLFLAVKATSIDPYLVDDFGGISFAGDSVYSKDKWQFNAFITSVEIVDSMLFVNTLDGFLTTYRIAPDFNLAFLENISIPGRVTKSLIYNDQLVLFYSSSMELFDYSSPSSIKSIAEYVMGMEILDGKFRNDTLFAISNNSLAIFELFNNNPTMMQQGGQGGIKLEVTDNLLIASNGETIDFYIYSYLVVGDNETISKKVNSFSVSQNYPNPFNATTSFSFSLSQVAPVEISILNILGQRVRILNDRTFSAGNYQIEWDGKNELGETVATGVYFYKINSGQESISKKMLFLK